MVWGWVGGWMGVWWCSVLGCGVGGGVGMGVKEIKESELRRVDPHHLCVRPPKYLCTSISAVIIDTWPTDAVYC